MTRLVPPASATSEQTADSTTLVTLDGDFDLANVAAIRHRLSDMLAIAGHNIIVDLRGVTFADSTMLSTLIAGLRRAEAHRQRLLLIRPNETVWKAFAITGVDKLFTAFADLAEARSYLAAADAPAVTT
jgi:anti-sigma B factor antagonist